MLAHFRRPWWASKEFLIPVLPWILAFCGRAVANKCTSGLAQLEAPTCKLLTTPKSGSLVIPAAIPMLPIIPKHKDIHRPQGIRKLERGKRRLGDLYLDDIYEGSFNFAHPGYIWMLGWQSFEADGVHETGTKSGLRRLKTVKVHDVAILSYDSEAAYDVIHLPVDKAQRGARKVVVEMDKGSEWLLYAITLICGPFLCIMLACCMSTRATQESNDATVAIDEVLDDEISDDEMVFPEEVEEPSTRWISLLRNLLRFRAAQNENIDGMSTEEIQKMPLVLHCEDDHSHTGCKFRCIICLNDVKDGEILREMKGCQHRFHPLCVDPWLERSATCPLCRKDLVEEGEDADEGSPEEVQEPETMPEPSISYNDEIEEATSSSDDEEEVPVPASVTEELGYTGPISLEPPLCFADIEPEPELPNSYRARSIDSDSWTEASGFSEEWELVENG